MARTQALANPYLHKLTLLDVLRHTFGIFGRSFWTLILIPALGFGAPLLIGIALTLTGWALSNNAVLVGALTVLTLALLYFSIFVVSAATTVALSEIALGNRPSVLRAYRRVFGLTLGKLVATSLLQGIILCFGVLLLIVPGIVFWFWYMLVPAVVVLENTWGQAALRRSRELGRGHRARMFAYYALFTMCVFILFVIIGFGATLIHKEYGVLLTYLLQVLSFPLFSIPMVLFYYDLRVRKEGYDIGVLSETLRD